MTHSIVENDYACENCKEKFENDELPKCERCRRLKTKSNIDFSSGKYICDCIKDNENLEEKALPSVPYESQAVFYERQINSLREEKNQLEEEADTHLEALEISEVWNKRQKQELLDEIKRLKKEVERLKKQTPQGLVKEVEELKKQLEQANQQLVQIEVPPKENKIKNFFKFGSK